MQNIVTCTIRVNEESWDKLKKIADINKRSMNKEIEYIIDQRITEYKEILDKNDVTVKA